MPNDVIIHVKGDTKNVEQSFDRVKGAAGGVSGALSGVVSGLGKIGLAGMGVSVLTDTVKGLGSALGLGLNVELENVRAQLFAFTKDGEQTEKILKDIREEANKTPFAFQEMAKATASLLPASKQSGVALMDMVKTAEMLAALNPMQGLEGAAFSLREALSGDFVSIVERFNLPRQRLNELKAQGVPALQAISMALSEMGVDASLVSNMAQTATGRWSTFKDTIDTLRVTVSKPLFDMLSSGLAKLQPLLDANMPMLTRIAENIGTGLVSAIEGGINAIQTISGWIEGLTTAAQGGSDGIKQFAGVVLVDLQALGNHILSLLGDFLPPFSEQLKGWGKAFVEWVVPMIPVLLNKMQDLREKMTAWIIEQIPGWIDALGKWAVEFVAWVAPMINPLLRELLQFASRVLDWIIVTAPVIAEKFLAEWLPAAIKWVALAALEIAQELPSILWTISKWIVTEGVPKVFSLFWDLGTAIVRGIIKGILSMAGDLAGAIGGVIQGAVPGLAPTDFNPQFLGDIPEFAHGGIVPGNGPSLAVVHGGERITPSSGSSPDRLEQVLRQLMGILQEGITVSLDGTQKARSGYRMGLGNLN